MAQFSVPKQYRGAAVLLVIITVAVLFALVRTMLSSYTSSTDSATTVAVASDTTATVVEQPSNTAVQNTVEPTICVSAGDGTLDIHTGDVTDIVAQFPAENVREVAWSPDGTRAYWVRTRENGSVVEYWDREDAAQHATQVYWTTGWVHTLQVANNPNFLTVFEDPTPDGENGYYHNAYLLSAESTKTRRLGTQVSHIAWSPEAEASLVMTTADGSQFMTPTVDGRISSAIDIHGDGQPFVGAAITQQNSVIALQPENDIFPDEEADDALSIDDEEQTIHIRRISLITGEREDLGTWDPTLDAAEADIRRTVTLSDTEDTLLITERDPRATSANVAHFVFDTGEQRDPVRVPQDRLVECMTHDTL